jgi:hypothetical protein
MKKVMAALAAIVWSAGGLMADVPVVPAMRWIVIETATNTVWMDRMTDGTVRDSVVPKAPTAVAVRLLATNDVGFAWRFDYETMLTDGSVITNASFRVKPKKAQLEDLLAALPEMRPPDPATNSTERIERAQLSLPAAQAMAQAVTQVKRRQERNYVMDSAPVAPGLAEYRWSDGSVSTAGMQRAVSGRKKAPAGHLLAKETAAMARRMGADPGDSAAVAQALREHRAKLDTLETEATKSKGKAGALGVLAGIALGLAGKAAARKKASQQ